MSYLAQYKKEDFRKLSWEEYGEILEKLYGKVAKYVKKGNIKMDAVVPILRGGSFPGAYLAYKLHLLRVVPVQYKYFFIKEKIVLKKLLGVPKTGIKLPKKPTFLLVENNHCFGLTAATAAKDLKKEFLGCRIIYAVDTMDYSCQKAVDAEVTFYGKLNNETRGLSREEANEKGLTNDMSLFPWEDLEEEWTTVQGKQFRYRDVKIAIESSKSKVVVEQ
jgi:hypothetical protein